MTLKQSQPVRLREVVKLLEENYPSELALSWDHTGFSFGSDISKVVTGVLVCLDLTASSLDLAREKNINLIITRHPFKFLKNPSKERFFYPYKADLIKRIREERLSIFSLHTNFELKDATASREIVACLFKDSKHKISLEAVKDLSSAIVVKGQFTLLALMEQFSLNLGIESFRYLKRADIKKPIKSFLLLPGSWSSRDFIGKIKLEDIDLIIASELRWSDWVSFNESSLPLLLEIPHLVETFFNGPLESLFKRNYPDLPFFSSIFSLPYVDYRVSSDNGG